ncbi:MAG: hypothetical protein P4L36_21480 [Holophaga sp.]|nr:hypothetical protein [Holophaga sp.]
MSVSVLFPGEASVPRLPDGTWVSLGPTGLGRAVSRGPGGA